MKLLVCLSLLVLAVNASVINRRAAETDLGTKVQADLKAVLSEIETAVDQGKTVAKDLLSKGHTLLEQAKTIGGQVWHSAQGELSKLNSAASNVFSDFLKGASNLWHELQHVLGKRSVERRFLQDDLKAFNDRLSKDLQALFHDASGRITEFNKYIANLFHKEVAAAKPVIDNVKELANNFLASTEAKSQDVIKQAQTFFEPYKHDLGEVWTEIECEYQHIVHSGPACSAASRREAVALEAELKKVLADIEATVAGGEKVAHELLQKGKTLLEQAKVVGGKVWESSKGELTKLSTEASTIFSGVLKGAEHLWQEIHTAFGKRETQTDLGAQIEAELKTVLKQIETTVDDGKQVAHDLLDKGKTLLSQAKVTGGQVWQNAQAELSKLNGAASTVFGNFLKTASDFWHEIVHAFGKRDAELEKRFLLDSFKALSEHLGADLQKIFGQVGTQFHAFNDYLTGFFQKQAAAAKPVVDNVKQLASSFLSATQQKTTEVVTQAKTFFEPYKHDLGELWSEIQCSYNHIVHNAAATCQTATL